MNPEPKYLVDPVDVPVLLQSAARNLRLVESDLAEILELPEKAFAPFAEKENLAFLSECLMRHEMVADRLRRVVARCRSAYHPGGR